VDGSAWVSTNANVGVGVSQASQALHVAGTVRADGLQVGASSFDSVDLALLRELLDHITFVDEDDGNGNALRTLRLSAVNLQLVNGLGATNGNAVSPFSLTSTTTNGLGNLIIGYNEESKNVSNDRTGSHTLVLGTENNYLGFGGAVMGRRHSLEGPYSVISGGEDNTTYGNFAATIGGANNVASGDYATVSGGIHNAAAGTYSSVAGGFGGSALGSVSTLGGGLNRSAVGTMDWVAGTLLQDNRPPASPGRPFATVTPCGTGDYILVPVREITRANRQDDSQMPL
jgi:hypothetical protein